MLRRGHTRPCHREVANQDFYWPFSPRFSKYRLKARRPPNEGEARCTHDAAPQQCAPTRDTGDSVARLHARVAVRGLRPQTAHWPADRKYTLGPPTRLIFIPYFILFTLTYLTSYVSSSFLTLRLIRLVTPQIPLWGYLPCLEAVPRLILGGSHLRLGLGLGSGLL